MKLTAFSIGTRGDVEPLIELGVEMIRRGHEFRVAAMDAFAPLCAKRNVPFVHLDGDADYFTQLMVTDYRTSKDFITGYERFYASVPRIFDQIADAVKEQDAVFYGTCSFFVRSAADLYHVPCIRYFYSPFDRTNQYSLYTGRHNSFSVGLTYFGEEFGMNYLTMKIMNHWRMEHGLRKWTLSDDYRIQNGQKVLTFYPVSPILMPKDPKWGNHIHIDGYWFHPEEIQYHPDQDLLTFLENHPRPIFVTFGKAASKELKQLQLNMIQALIETKIPAVIQANQLRKEDISADHLFPIDQVSYPWIFKQVRAVVHHGGNSTNGLGLRAGLPTLIIPIALDQYYYGRTDYEIGCGPMPLYARKQIPEVNELKTALSDLVSGKYDKKAKEIGASIQKENGCLTAAIIIEEWHKSLIKKS